MLWQFFSLPGIENGIEYRYFSRYRIEVRNSSIVTTLILNMPDLHMYEFPLPHSLIKNKTVKRETRKHKTFSMIKENNTYLNYRSKVWNH